MIEQKSLANLDIETFRQLLEEACGRAVETARKSGKEAGQAQLTGLFDGLIALARGLTGHSWHMEFLDIAREITEDHRRRIRDLDSE